MDLAFEIILPIEDILSSIEFQLPEYEWQGEKYPQGPPEASIHFFKLIKSSVPPHILTMLPNTFKTLKWQCISVLGNGMDIIKERLLGMHEEDEINELYDLLHILLDNKAHWVIVFEPDYDRIDEIGSGNIDDVLKKIKTSLMVEKLGFVIWHKNP